MKTGNSENLKLSRFEQLKTKKRNLVKINGPFEPFRANENTRTETSNLETFWWDTKRPKNSTNFQKLKTGPIPCALT